MKQKVSQGGQRYEVRQYWHSGVIIDRELWRNGQIVLAVPHRLPTTTVTVDRCATHGTYIYADLPCRMCQERPGVAATRTGAPSLSAA